MQKTIILLSWNVNGIRAVHKKGFLGWLAEATPNILCLQETRAEEIQLPAWPDRTAITLFGTTSVERLSGKGVWFTFSGQGSQDVA